MDDKTEKSFSRLFDVVKTLRGEGGCPWDRDQTPLSMRQYLVEETFEACDAINSNDPSHAKEELGDVLLNALMMSYMYEQNGDFNVSDVFNDIIDKLIRRHPHVYLESAGKTEMKENVTSSGQVMNQWERIKSNIEGRETESVLDEVPQGFPPMLKAYKMLKKASKKNFEWDNIKEVSAKVEEEWCEVKDALSEVNKAKINGDDKSLTVSGGNKSLNDAQLHLEEEIGDLLLSVINFGRWSGVDPENAMNRAVKKFYNRFTFIEKTMNENKISMDKEHTAQMIDLWNKAKKK